MTKAQDWIEGLQLQPHPEGGYFRETYRSPETIARQHLPPRFSGDRAFATAIYFLLQGDDFSALHRIKQDEIWHFYEGCSLTIRVIDPGGDLSSIRLGRDARAREVPQAVVRAGCLFGARVNDPRSYALVGCTVAPGFDFADFEMPTRQTLVTLYPQHKAIIEQLTR
ncbi:MAG: cupin domain-containing protein [Planctomycetaceae bacterium]|nr:cupin domain-containing protein [Planctomycetaceae bacterium]